MDTNGAYSLQLTGADENYFEDCMIGLDTISRGSASCSNEILIKTNSGASNSRNIFKGCYIIGYCTSAANYVFLRVDSAGVSRFVMFDNCVFINPATATGSGVSMTTGFNISNTAGGLVILKDTVVTGCDDLNSAANTGLILTNQPAYQTTDAAILVANVKT